MELLVLTALVSLVSAGCNNIVPSECGQNSAVTLNPFNRYAKIFNIAFKQPAVTDTSGNMLRRRKCLSVDVIPITITDLYCKQPSYTRMVETSAKSHLLDNTCVTFFPVPDDDKSLIAYISTVFTDGSNEVQTLIYTETAPGVFGVAGAEYTISQRFFASIGRNLFVACTRTEFGNSVFPAIDVATLTSLTPLRAGCSQQVQQILDCNGLSQPEGLTVLPYRLPTKCYTQQTCFSSNPLTPSTHSTG